MFEEIGAIPLVAVSSKTKRKEVEKKIDKPKNFICDDLLNEEGVQAGKFGWCVNCRQAANLFCKHTRYPVCSFDCKTEHIRLLERVNTERST